MKRNLALLMVLVLMFSLFVCGCKNSDNEENTAINEPVTTKSTENAEATVVATQAVTEVKALPPDTNGAVVSLIEGYNANSAAQSGTVESNAVILPYVIEGTSLKITAMGGYTGEFVEDSSDESVKGVFAVVVQNTADSPLKSAGIIITDSNGEEYSFKLSALPSMKSVLLMEESKKSYSHEMMIENIEASESFADAFELNEESISLGFDGENLKLKNISDGDFTAVYVRYKNYTAGNVYLGGITYSATFNSVKAGEEYTYKPAHMYTDKSEILMVEVIL